MANVQKLEQVLDHIRMNPEQHDQRMWAMKTKCGTTMCFAGWTVALEGYDFAWVENYPIGCRSGEDGRWTKVAGDWAEKCVAPGSDVRIGLSVENVAALILGLDDTQRRALFFSAQTFDEVEQTVKDIINAEKAA